jgi:hypothetical protein
LLSNSAKQYSPLLVANSEHPNPKNDGHLHELPSNVSLKFFL